VDKNAFIEACQEGGMRLAQVFKQIHRDYASGLMRECMACLHDSHQAQEVVQEALLKAWQSCGQFRGQSQLFPWLQKIARNKAIDLVRGRTTTPIPPDDADESAWAEVQHKLSLLGASDLPDDIVHSRRLLESYRVHEARFALCEPEAAAMIRWIAEDGLTLAEVAELLGRTSGATRQYLYQCRQKARRHLAPWYREVQAGRPMAEPGRAVDTDPVGAEEGA
jgi:RNA polymerase sigma factor (sigma-70 family)